MTTRHPIPGQLAMFDPPGPSEDFGVWRDRVTDSVHAARQRLTSAGKPPQQRPLIPDMERAPADPEGTAP